MAMPELEAFKFALQFGLSGVFFWLYYVTNQRLQEQNYATNQRLQEQNAKHEADIARLYEMRVQELRLMARMPTDLEGSRPAHQMQPGY